MSIHINEQLSADHFGKELLTSIDQMSPIERLAAELSDVITFHYYGPYTNMIPLIELLRDNFDRPLINNEWLNRLNDNNYKEIFPLFYLEKIGSYSWGLMQGYSQTFEPWGGYFRNPDFMDGKLDLTKWQHDLYRPGGRHPYDPNEIDLIVRINKRADARDIAKK